MRDARLRAVRLAPRAKSENKSQSRQTHFINSRPLVELPLIV